MDSTRFAQRLAEDLQSIHSESFTSDADRVKVKDAVMAALPHLETPWETAFRLVFLQVGLSCLLKLKRLQRFRLT